MRSSAVPWVLALLGWAGALYAGNELLRAGARAEAMRAAFDAATATYDSTISVAELRLQARGDTLRQVERDRAELRARAAVVAEARPEEPDLEPYLPPEIAGLWQAWRTSVLEELALLRMALEVSDRQIAALGRQLVDREAQLAAVQGRLAVALEGWEASERARRPSLTTWLTRGLAVVGIVALTKEGVAALTP